MSDELETKVANRLPESASEPGKVATKGGYIPDYKKTAGHLTLIVAGFSVAIIAVVVNFKMKVSKDKVIFADEAKLVGVAKSEEVKGSKDAYSRIAADYAGYVFTRTPEGIARADMLPYICTDECRQRILDKQSAVLRNASRFQTVFVRGVQVVKQFQSGMEVRVDAVLRQASAQSGRKQDTPTVDLNVAIFETLEYSRRPLEAGMYPFLLTDISIEAED